MSLTKAILTDNLCEKIGISKDEAKDLVDCFYAEIAAALADGASVKLAGFGTFGVRDKKARPGLNPRTREQVQVSARRVVTFKAGGKLKEQVSGVG